MADPQLTLSREHVDAVLFDLDGVVTNTTELQALAWKRLFDDWMLTHPPEPGEDHSPFDAARDYRRYIDGRPRDKGVKHFLLARGVELPDGQPDDGPERDTIHGLGQRKNALFIALLDEQGVEAYGCAVALLRQLRRAGIRTAAVTASKNCDAILARTEIGELFDTRVDGIDAEREDLAGKPDPDTLLEAARRLGVEPARMAVLDDTVAGVRAAGRGRFGLIIGVDRGGQRETLTEHGAHLVFDDLCQIDVASASDEVPAPLTAPPATAAAIAARRPALFLEYDGALLPLDADPTRPDPELRRLLHQLALAMPVTVISGRDVDELRRLLGLPRIIYAGSHGFDIQGPTLSLELPEAIDARDEVAAAAAALEQDLAGIPGARVERRRFAVLVDGRELPEPDLERLTEAANTVAADFPRLRVTRRGPLLELRPDIDWDSGHTVRRLLAELELDNAGALPVYIGGSETAEDAFREIRQDGLGILVASTPRPSAAHHRIAEGGQVTELLRALAAHI